MMLTTIVGWAAVGLACVVLPEPDVPEPDGTAAEDEPAEDEPDEPGEPDASPRERARILAQRGEAAFTAGRYDEAGTAYRAAYALDPVPLLLFAWARSEQEAGRCEQAISIYQRFIATGPPPEDVDRANLEVGRCYGKIAPEPQPQPEVEPEPQPEVTPEPQPTPAPRDPRMPRAPWLRDPWGGVLMATGVVGLSAGTGLYLQALADDRRATRARTTDEFRAASQRATTFSGAGIAGFAVGSALVVGAVVRYAVVASRRPRVELGGGLRSVGLRVRF